MTQDEIIKMAWDSGAYTHRITTWGFSLENLERFAAAIAAEEREALHSENERLAPIQWKQLKPPRHSGQEHMTAKKYLQILYSRLWNRKKPWVGLTVEEIAACCMESTTTQLSFYNAIEAKLKEKNT